MKRLVLAIALATVPQVLATQSSASSYCGTSGQPVLQTVGNALFGDWTINHHAGYVSVGGMTMAYPAVAGEQMKIMQGANGSIELTDPQVTKSIPLVDATEPPWSFRNNQPNTAGVNPVLTDSDISILVGCNANSLPRLIGHGTFNVPQAGPMAMTVRLIVLTDSTMFGIMEFTGNAQGMAYFSRRSVALTK